MERTITKDNKIIPSDSKYKKPSMDEVEEKKRLEDKNEEGKPKEGGSAGREQIGITTIKDEVNPRPRRSNTS
ncbi:hypothetical protein C1645_827265 [Glomus cerebriforme]|uniref:Uncharacterized protein n=1 Tax=Glomus cerebriforme TaxID=658196 RepID=A0A397SNK6_9GLOM|nr:hypothetical protein C1645_827265 [Glomus cerebriforme]